MSEHPSVNVMRNYFPLLGRIFFSQIFLLAAVKKMLDFESSWKYMELNGVPIAPLLLMAAITFELGGGLFLLLGFQTRFAALLLIVFLIPTTLIFHLRFDDPVANTNFVKNLALIGGLFTFLYHGGGPYSVDSENGS